MEYVQAEVGDLPNFQETNSIGGINIGKDNLKILWMSEDLSPQTLANGGDLLIIKLKTKVDIANLQDVLYLDESILETFFLTAQGDCVDNVSLQLAVDVLGVLDRSDDGLKEEPGEKAGQESQLLCFPNPFKDGFKLVFDSGHDFNGMIRFYDVSGKMIDQKSHNFREGRHIMTFDAEQKFKSGLLHFVIIDGEKIHSTRLFRK